MNKLYDETQIQSIADAIREKTETKDTMKLSEMADKIKSIKAGDGSPIAGFGIKDFDLSKSFVEPTSGLTSATHSRTGHEVTCSHQDDPAWRLFNGTAADNSGWAVSPSNIEYPEWVDLKMPYDVILRGMLYCPSSLTNERVTDYEVQISNDGETYETVHEGAFDVDATFKELYIPIETDKICNHIRFVVKDSNGHGVNWFKVDEIFYNCSTKYDNVTIYDSQGG